MNPPVADRIPVTLKTAGHKRTDEYYWMKRRGHPQVMKYLEAENAYTEKMMADTAAFKERLFAEITGRIRQDDSSVPYFKNGYFYYTRFAAGGEYPVYCRRCGSMDAAEEVLLDGNAMAAGHAYFHIGGCEVSPDNRLLAYCVDTVGRYTYTVMFKDLQTGEGCGAIISGTAGSLAWADDNQTVFYTLKNPETLRSERLMAHTHGSCDPDRTVHHEEDEMFDLEVYRSRSDRMIIMLAYSHTSTEYRFLDVAEPAGMFRMVQAREKGLEYQLAHYQDRFYIVTNWEARNFRLMETPVAASGKEHWTEVIPHREDVLLEEIEVFRDFMVVAERRNGLVQLRICAMDGGEYYVEFGEEAYMAEIAYNPAYDTELLRFSYSSLTTPPSTFDYDMRSRERHLLRQQEIVGGFNPDEYVARRLYACASDGKQIPISLVHRRDTVLNGETPLLLYGYGAYGHTIDPSFSVARISLLDRGFVFAVAHVRGGQTLGREWYEDGKLLNKRNTFTDFIACAEHLINEGFTDCAHLCAMGGSAGGLLIGAVCNMRPDLFSCVIAAVPFVDVITTMSDKSIPLTTGEYDEWGNPEEETFYQYMMQYSPYDNISAQAYPHMLVTTGIHDSQVQYWEPAKWVARLRTLKTDDNLLLLHTNMEAGHGGASGRFEQYRETALEYAFMCKIVQPACINTLQ